MGENKKLLQHVCDKMRRGEPVGNSAAKVLLDEVTALRAQVEELEKQVSRYEEYVRQNGYERAKRINAEARATRAEAAAERHKDNFHAMQDACTKRDKRIAELEAREKKLERVRAAAKLAEECEAKCAGKCPALPHEIDAVWADLRAALAECGEGE